MNKYPSNKERYIEGENKTNLNVWISKELKAKIKQDAKNHGMLLSKYVEKILQKSVEENEQVIKW